VRYRMRIFAPETYSNAPRRRCSKANSVTRYTFGRVYRRKTLDEYVVSSRSKLYVHKNAHVFVIYVCRTREMIECSDLHFKRNHLWCTYVYVVFYASVLPDHHARKRVVRYGWMIFQSKSKRSSRRNSRSHGVICISRLHIIPFICPRIR
jgi:hypothetical protein